MRLMPITLEGCQRAREWRNDYRQSLRTTIMLTYEQQEEFFKKLQDRNSEDRYWEVHDDNTSLGMWPMIAMAGLTDIDWTNRLAEISLFVSPTERRKGLGKECVRLILEEAFDHMNLHQVLGECFRCNPCCGFWEKEVKAYGGSGTELPHRKWWNGKYWDSYYFSIFDTGWYATIKKAGGISG